MGHLPARRWSVRREPAQIHSASQIWHVAGRHKVTGSDGSCRFKQTILIRGHPGPRWAKFAAGLSVLIYKAWRERGDEDHRWQHIEDRNHKAEFEGKKEKNKHLTRILLPNFLFLFFFFIETQVVSPLCNQRTHHEVKQAEHVFIITLKCLDFHSLTLCFDVHVIHQWCVLLESELEKWKNKTDVGGHRDTFYICCVTVIKHNSC